MKQIKVMLFNPSKDKEATNKDFIVASTKSENNLIDDYKSAGYFAQVVNTKEFYLDRDIAIELSKSASEKLGVDISEAFVKALETACIVKRLEK